MTSELNFETAIRCWLDATRDSLIPTGLSVEQATLQATEWLASPPGADAGTVGAAVGSDLADVLHAFCHVLENVEADLEKIRVAYDLIAESRWQEDEFCERELLLSKLAYLAWRGSRRRGDFASMNHWKTRCVESVMAQTTVRDFLTLPFQDRSPDLTLRFLNEPAVVLTVSTRLAVFRNVSPAMAANEAAFAYTCLLEACDGIELESRNHLAAEFALSVCVATRHLGRFSESTAWALRAGRLFAKTESGDAFQAQVDFQHLCIAYERGEFRWVTDRVAAVISSLRAKDPTNQLGRCQFVQALALKDEGLFQEALGRLEGLRNSIDGEADPLLLGLVLANMGESLAGMSNYAAAMRYLQDAIELLRVANVPFAVANFRGILGEVLRDQGRLTEAIDSYRAGLASYCDLEMSARAAYLRVILAETLIAAGREGEATAEILRALPILRREQLVPSALAALTLLQESLRRQEIDPHALRQLRDHLDRCGGRGPT